MTTPLTAVDTELDKVLTKLENEVARDVEIRMIQHRSGKAPKRSHLEAHEAIKALIGTIAEQIIGEDEIVTNYDLTKSAQPERDNSNLERNELRYEQRQRKAQLMSTPANGSANPEAPERLKDYMENKQ